MLAHTSHSFLAVSLTHEAAKFYNKSTYNIPTDLPVPALGAKKEKSKAMQPDTQLMQQLATYEPWLIGVGVIALFVILHFTRKTLRRRIDEIGYRLMGEKGLYIWFWLNAPGVIIHELSHAAVIFLFSGWGFRITSITLFRIRPKPQEHTNGQIMRKGGATSLQLGEVQYVRPKGHFMSEVGDGLSGIAPIFGGTAMFILLYWVATGYSLWNSPLDTYQHLQLIRPGWPWWTLIFAPYLILTITSELWPSRQDWRGARWFVIDLSVLLVLALIVLWYTKYLLLMLPVALLIASRIDFALLILLMLDLCFILIAEAVVRIVRHRS